MTSMEAIYARHSVRSYEDRPIEGEDLARLESLVETCAQESGLNIQLVQNNPEVFNMVARFGLIRGANACIAFVAKQRTQDEAIGYWGQHIVLEAQRLGLNTCWAMMFNRKKCRAICPEGEAVRVVIAIGYGKTNGKPRPSKTASKVVRIEPGAKKPAWFDTAVEAALLAPTGMNKQDFIITLAADGTVNITAPGNGLTNIDLGIVRRNFEVAAAAVDAGQSSSGDDVVKTV